MRKPYKYHLKKPVPNRTKRDSQNRKHLDCTYVVKCFSKDCTKANTCMHKFNAMEHMDELITRINNKKS